MMLRAAVAYPAPRRFSRLLAAIALCISLALIGLVWTRAVTSLARPKPVPVRLKPSAIAWGDRVFSDKQHLNAWLHSRGSTYAEWASHHPAALRILYPTAKITVPPATTTAVTTAAKPATARTAAARSAQATTTKTSTAPSANLRALLVGWLAIALLVAAAAPKRLWGRLGAASPTMLPQYRIYLAAAAAALLVALMISAAASP